MIFKLIKKLIALTEIKIWVRYLSSGVKLNYLVN